MKSSLLPVNPGSSSAVPRTGPAGGSARSTANPPRAVSSRTLRAEAGSLRNGGVLMEWFSYGGARTVR